MQIAPSRWRKCSTSNKRSREMRWKLHCIVSHILKWDIQPFLLAVVQNTAAGSQWIWCLDLNPKFPRTLSQVSGEPTSKFPWLYGTAWYQIPQQTFRTLVQVMFWQVRAIKVAKRKSWKSLMYAWCMIHPLGYPCYLLRFTWHYYFQIIFETNIFISSWPKYNT